FAKCCCFHHGPLNHAEPQPDFQNLLASDTQVQPTFLAWSNSRFSFAQHDNPVDIYLSYPFDAKF
ncbi:MAG: hypothetical protein ACYTF1_24185, partial [Planctomycetota bacterium]